MDTVLALQHVLRSSSSHQQGPSTDRGRWFNVLFGSHVAGSSCSSLQGTSSATLDRENATICATADPTVVHVSGDQPRSRAISKHGHRLPRGFA